MGQKLDLQQLNLRGDKLEMSAVDPTGGFQSDHLFSSEGVSRSPPAVAAFALCLRSDGKHWTFGFDLPGSGSAVRCGAPIDEMVEPGGGDWPDTDEERGPRMDFPPPVPCHATSLLQAAMTAMRFGSQSREHGGYGDGGVSGCAQGAGRDPAGSAARGGFLIEPLNTIRSHESSNKRRATETIMTFKGTNKNQTVNRNQNKE